MNKSKEEFYSPYCNALEEFLKENENIKRIGFPSYITKDELSDLIEKCNLPEVNLNFIIIQFGKKHSFMFGTKRGDKHE